MSGRVAAVLAGLVAAAVIVGLTKAAFSLCEWIQGTDSCGGPGFFLLVAILVLAVVLGSLTLRLCGVAESGTTSFLAVGLTSVIALLFLVDQLFDWWMVIAIPLVSVATFLLSYWVTDDVRRHRAGARPGHGARGRRPRRPLGRVRSAQPPPAGFDTLGRDLVPRSRSLLNHR